jgi:hypothetical protein
VRYEQNESATDDSICDNYVVDEGRSLGFVLQKKAPNHLALLRSKAVVVSRKDRSGIECHRAAASPTGVGRLRMRFNVTFCFSTASLHLGSGDPLVAYFSYAHIC